MTPADLRRARKALGLSAEGFARWVHTTDGASVRRWERGVRDIPGPVQVLVQSALDSADVRAYFGLPRVLIDVPEDH